jgi:molybdopterin-dependent oxidoreductase alpha subunit
LRGALSSVRGTMSEQPPLEPTPARLERPSRAAAGLKAVNKTAELVQAMGVKSGVQALLAMNQTDGFDCQSCAWPSPDEHRHTFEFCENGAKALADEATPRRCDREFFRTHSVEQLRAQSDYWLNQQGRLTEPFVLRPGALFYEPIAWPDAFALLAHELRALTSPDEAVFYTSGRTSNEAAFLWQLFARRFGTNNLPDCSNMCHESSGAALSDSIGIGKGTVTLADFEKADAIFMIGQNPGTNHPRMLGTLEAAKRAGATIVSINPMPELGLERFKNPQDFLNPLKALPTLLGSGSRLADVWVQPRIGGDLALMKGIMKAMLEEERRRPGEVFDHAFIREHTTSYAELVADLERTEWREIMEACGVERETIERLATIAIRSRSTICCWAMGLTQQPHSVATIQQVVNFLLLRGNVGRPGAGACPVRGHSNVQGDRTMGIWEKMPDAWLDRLDAEFGFRSPRQHGLDTVDSIRAMHDGRIRVFVGMGGNFLSATPDTDYTAAGLRRCSLTAHVSTKLNRAHLVTGRTALILPCLGRSERDRQESGEQFVTTEDSMGIINASRGVLPPVSPDLFSEVGIVCRLARAVFEPANTGSDTSAAMARIPWAEFEANYDAIRDRIARVVPGFEEYNRRVRAGSFYLPNAPRDRREWRTATKKANFRTASIPLSTLAAGEYLMMTIRSHDQFNTTIYGLDDRYRGVFAGRRVVFMNADDAKDAGLQVGQLVDLANDTGGVRRVAPAFMVAPYSLPRGCVATYFPEANVLVPIDSVAAVSNTPASKYVPVRLTPSPESAYGERLASTASR